MRLTSTRGENGTAVFSAKFGIQMEEDRGGNESMRMRKGGYLLAE